MKKIIITVLCVLAVTAVTADAKRGKKHAASLGPVVTVAVVVDDYCATYCQPSEWTLVEGTTCDYTRAICLLDDGTGQPNCAWAARSCD